MTEFRKYYGRTFAYEEFMAAEGIPVHRAVVGVEAVTALPRAPWARTGGLVPPGGSGLGVVGQAGREIA
jgi:hypothetical protein